MHEAGVVEHQCMRCGCVCSQVCMQHRCFEHQHTLLRAYVFATHPLQGMHMRSCMHSLFSLSLGDEGGGVELVYVGHLFAGMEGYFDMRKIGVLSVFSLFFDGGWRVCRCMLWMHTDTHLQRLGTRDVS